MADKIRVTVKEKILLHLLPYSKHKDDFEVPQDLTQDGMASVVGVRRSHIASALKDLKQKEFVSERKTRIAGHERRKNAYFLTHEGEGEALRLKEHILDKTIVFVNLEGEEREMKIPELRKLARERPALLEVLNRLTDDGIFREKPPEKAEEEVPEREEEKEVLSEETKETLEEEVKEVPEKKVVCPLCGGVNLDYEARSIVLSNGNQGYSVTCSNCQGDFLLGVTEGDSAVPGVQPSVYPFEAAPGTVDVAAKVERESDPFIIGLGFIFMLAAFISVVLVVFIDLPGSLLVMAPIGILLSLGLFLTGLGGVNRLDRLSKMMLLVASALFMSTLMLGLGLFSDITYDPEQAALLVMVIIPAFFVLAFAKPMASDLRSELAMSLGLFFILFGFFSFALPDLFSYSASFSPFWVIAGASLVMISFEIEKLENPKIFRALCMGAGAFTAILCLMVMLSGEFSLGILKLISLVLWFLVGVFLVLVRFFKEDRLESMLSAIKSSMISGLGVLFLLVGIILATNGRYMEFAVELFVGIPIILYGLGNVKKFSQSQLGVVAFLLISESFLVLSFILT